MSAPIVRCHQCWNRPIACSCWPPVACGVHAGGFYRYVCTCEPGSPLYKCDRCDTWTVDRLEFAGDDGDWDLCEACLTALTE